MTDHRLAAEHALKEITAALDNLAATITAALDDLATVGTPAPTLTERLREQFHYPEQSDEQHGIILDAAQMERDLAEARDEVERLTAERLDRNSETDARDKAALNNLDKAETVAVQKGAESNAESIDPADVPAGEAWLVECRGERRAAVKDRGGVEPWNTVSADGRFWPEENGRITLVSRLVPAPRVITNPDDLDALAEGTIVRDKDGDAWRRTCDEWTTTADYGRFTSWAVSRSGPVTVLWEPEA